MNTDFLIERLARDLKPVRPLTRPWMRAALWLLGTSLYLGALTLSMTSKEDVATNATQWRFVVQQLAAIATGISAAAAALVSVVPGYSRRVFLLPAVAVTAWLGTISVGFPQEWHETGMAGVAVQREWLCVLTIVLGGVLPAGGLAVMLRRGAPLTPRLTTALGALAAAGLANVVACVSHPHPSSIAVLVWHGSTVLALFCLGGAIGRSVLAWRIPSNPQMQNED
jgi:hypothetical protein